MKTRDRILHTSLLLFNEEGEAATTTVDIANELDISPGNLYYHFKGKDVIIAELFSQFELSVEEVLQAPTTTTLNVEDNWYYLYVVFEELYTYRFLYRNLDDLLERYPSLRKRFQRILNHKQDALRAVLHGLTEQAQLQINDRELSGLITNLALLLTYWLNFDHLLHSDRDPALLIHQGVYQLMVMMMPYLQGGQLDFYQQIQELYANLS